MDTTFNFTRFLKVLSNEWRLNLKKILLFWGAILIVTVIFFAFLRYVEPDIVQKKSTLALSLWMMCLLQGFYIQIYYREFSSKTKTQALLLLPASRNETFWAKFLLGIILYSILFFVYMFIVIKWTGIHNEWIKAVKPFPEYDWRWTYFENYQTLMLNLLEKLVCFLICLFSASAYLFGNMCFKKQPAFKSLALWFIIIMGLVLITCIIYASFTGVWPSVAMPGITIVITTTIDKYGYGCSIAQIYPELLYGLGIFICLALIFISRIKYNEKTI